MTKEPSSTNSIGLCGPAGCSISVTIGFKRTSGTATVMPRTQGQCRTYGVFEVSEGVAVRHHSHQWIASLLGDWEEIDASDIQVVTMNGNEASGFQWLVRRPLEG